MELASPTWPGSRPVVWFALRAEPKLSTQTDGNEVEESGNGRCPASIGMRQLRVSSDIGSNSRITAEGLLLLLRIFFR